MAPLNTSSRRHRNRLSDREMDAIFAHELCHLRRRDNLTAAIHMLVEASFWFCPLVWWLGARLIAEPNMLRRKRVGIRS